MLLREHTGRYSVTFQFVITLTAGSTVSYTQFRFEMVKKWWHVELYLIGILKNRKNSKLFWIIEMCLYWCYTVPLHLTMNYCTFIFQSVTSNAIITLTQGLCKLQRKNRCSALSLILTICKKFAFYLKSRVWWYNASHRDLQEVFLSLFGLPILP